MASKRLPEQQPHAPAPKRPRHVDIFNRYDQPESVKVAFKSPGYLDKIASNVERNGYCVVTGVRTPEECAGIKQRLITELVTPLLPGVEAFADFKWREFLPGSLKGMFQCGAAGHVQVRWDLLQDPLIAGIWSHLYSKIGETKLEEGNGTAFSNHARKYGPADMLASFDAVCVREKQVPPSRKIPNSNSTWYHLDQTALSAERIGYAHGGLRSLQGFFTAEDMPKSGTPLRVYPFSHKHHAAIIAALGSKPSPRNWLKLKPGDHTKIGEATRGEVDEMLYVDAPPGSIVLWDSRTIHMGGKSETGYEEHDRVVMYIAYQPRSFAGRSVRRTKKLGCRKEAHKKVMQKRAVAFYERRTTTHLCEGCSVFKPPRWTNKAPDTAKEFWKSPGKFVPMPVLTEFGKSLVGDYSIVEDLM